MKISEIRIEAERRILVAKSSAHRRYWDTIREMCVGLQGIEDAEAELPPLPEPEPVTPKKPKLMDRIMGRG